MAGLAEQNTLLAMLLKQFFLAPLFHLFLVMQQFCLAGAV
jgi:hypothetical protein